MAYGSKGASEEKLPTHRGLHDDAYMCWWIVSSLELIGACRFLNSHSLSQSVLIFTSMNKVEFNLYQTADNAF